MQMFSQLCFLNTYVHGLLVGADDHKSGILALRSRVGLQRERVVAFNAE